MAEVKINSKTRSSSRQTVVVLVHGIRTRAEWVKIVRAELEAAGFIVALTNYGYFDTFRFLLPIRALHNAPIEKVWDSVRSVRQAYPKADICFLAHSFGTFVVAHMLQRGFDFKAHRIVFCGSVVPYDFGFSHISNRFAAPILNEVGGRDAWPALGESVTWGYGSAGTYGFRVPHVRDRWHKRFGHSEFLQPGFCERFWVPFFRDGTIVEGDLSQEKPPLWVRLISGLRIRYVGVTVATGLAAYLGYVAMLDAKPTFDCAHPSNQKVTEQTICNYRWLATKDVKMNSAYRGLQDGLLPEDRRTLREQQRAWLDDRANCRDDFWCIARVYDARITLLQTVRERAYANRPVNPPPSSTPPAPAIVSPSVVAGPAAPSAPMGGPYVPVPPPP